MGRYKTTTNEKIGLISLNIEKIKLLYLAGWTDKQVADFIGVTKMTIERWKKDESFLLPLKDWKKEADKRVERSLYERACGYSHPAVKFFQAGAKILKQEYIEHHPPDATSMIFWLKNRQPSVWRDKQELEHSGELKSGTKIIIIHDERVHIQADGEADRSAPAFNK